MFFYLKRGVNLYAIDDLLVDTLQTVYEAYLPWGTTPVMTSGCDGAHCENSLHYKGKAWDFRVFDLKQPQTVADDIRRRLKEKSPHYQVLYGDKNHMDHIHIEYDENYNG